MAYTKTQGSNLIIPPYNQVGPPSFIREVTVPDSIKRVFPADPFASSTPRTVIVSESSAALYHTHNYIIDGKLTPFFDVLQAGREKSFDFSQVNNQCRMKLAAKIKNQNVNLAQAMVEFRSTSDLFLSLTQELYTGYRSLKYGHFKQSAKSLKRSRELSKKWIEFQFGLLPVVSDLQGLCDSLALGLRDGIELQATQSVKGEYRDFSRSFKDGFGNTVHHYEREDFSVRMKARYTIKHAAVHNISRFGFFNVPAVAWEAVPFSFVVDWMIPVGSWLSTLDALHGISSLVYIQGTENRWSGQRSSKGSHAHSRYTMKARTQTLSSLPIGFPTYTPSDSLKKVVTGLALLNLLKG